TRLLSGCLEDRGEQKRRGGLAVGAGDAGEAQLALGISLPAQRELGESLASGRDEEERRAPDLDRTLGEDGGRAPHDGVAGEIMPVEALARQADEERAVSHLPGVADDGADLGVGLRARR